MRFTIKDAHILAKQLKEKSSKIQGIDLFGSVSRNGSGHDIDFVCIVDDKIAQEWWSNMADIHVKWPPLLLFIRRIIKKLLPALDEAFVSKQKQRRQARVSNLIDVDLALFGEKYHSGTDIDVWLLPYDWRILQTLNKSAILRIANIADDHNTLVLLASAAREAVKLT